MSGRKGATKHVLVAFRQRSNHWPSRQRRWCHPSRPRISRQCTHNPRADRFGGSFLSFRHHMWHLRLDGPHQPLLYAPKGRDGLREDEGRVVSYLVSYTAKRRSQRQSKGVSCKGRDMDVHRTAPIIPPCTSSREEVKWEG
jgi:hypothetical protein